MFKKMSSQENIVRQLQFVRGYLYYEGYMLEHNSNIGYESDYQYTYSEWEASSSNDFTIVEESLEQLLDHIDHRIANKLGKGD